MDAKNHADLPHRAEQSASQPGRGFVNKLEAVRQQLAKGGRQRADREEGQRHGHRQAYQWRKEAFHRRGHDLVALALQPAAEPGGADDRDYRRGIVNKHNRHPEEGRSFSRRRRLKSSQHGGMNQRATDNQGNKRVATELFTGGIAEHQRQKVKQRVGRSE